MRQRAIISAAKVASPRHILFMPFRSHDRILRNRVKRNSVLTHSTLLNTLILSIKLCWSHILSALLRSRHPSTLLCAFVILSRSTKDKKKCFTKINVTFSRRRELQRRSGESGRVRRDRQVTEMEERV